MQPVRGLLGDARDLMVAPAGALNLIPLSALIDEHQRYLVQSYRFTYLTSGRDLLRHREQAPARQGAWVLANPNYDTAPAAGAALGGATTRSADLKKVRFSALPGTAQEASALEQILTDATVLTGAQATEAALKSVAGPQLLHVATHGFFLEDRPATEPRGGRRGLELQTDAATHQGSPRESPLLRSGLALAGANARGQGGDGEDGIVTAMEMVHVDLYGTKLVTLSACETGVGEVSNGEGVYGLRRALVLAGAETQLMSLWKVDDDATRDLMTAYYRRVQGGEGRSRALRQVQLEMLGAPRTAHPTYWAAFIVSGDPRTMDGGPAAPVDVHAQDAVSASLRTAPGPRGCACSAPGAPRPIHLAWLPLLAALPARRRLMAAWARAHRKATWNGAAVAGRRLASGAQNDGQRVANR